MNWTLANVHNAYGTLAVVGFTRLSPLPAGLLAPGHPWLTGRQPDTGRRIWPRNIAYASARMIDPDGPSDEQVVSELGVWLASLTSRSTRVPEADGFDPEPSCAVEYLQGSVHYNGGFLVFDDLADAMAHISVPRFVREIKRFSREERRELTVVLRDRGVGHDDLALFVAFLRSHLPWFADGHEAGADVLSSEGGPHPSVTLMNGSWIGDLARLQRGRVHELARPPFDTAAYFRGPFRGGEVDFTTTDRFYAWLMGDVLAVPGPRGGALVSAA